MSALTFKTVLVWAVPALAALAVYSNGLNGDFVFDDMVAIVRNKVGRFFGAWCGCLLVPTRPRPHTTPAPITTHTIPHDLLAHLYTCHVRSFTQDVSSPGATNVMALLTNDYWGEPIHSPSSHKRWVSF